MMYNEKIIRSEHCFVLLIEYNQIYHIGHVYSYVQKVTHDVTFPANAAKN